MSMSTALKVYEASEFPSFDPNSEAALALRENTAGQGFSEQDLVRVKMPTGGTPIWTINGPSGPEARASIDGIIVFKAYKGLIWPSLKELPGKKKKPVVVSNDLVTGKLNVPRAEVPPEMMEVLDEHEIAGAPGTYEWNALPYVQWGTGKNGRGKYAKEHILLFVLRVQEGEVLPLFIQVGVASMQIMRKFFLQTNIPYYRAFVSLALKEAVNADGDPYCTILPTLKGRVPEQFWATIENDYKAKLQASHEKGLIGGMEEEPD